jgi:hypothetical protein
VQIKNIVPFVLLIALPAHPQKSFHVEVKESQFPVDASGMKFVWVGGKPLPKSKAFDNDEGLNISSTCPNGWEIHYTAGYPKTIAGSINKVLAATCKRVHKP